MQLLLALAVVIVAIVSYLDVQRYSETLDFRFKSYGLSTNPTVVLIPGLDGATAFFSDSIPELTINFHVVQFYLPLFDRAIKTMHSDYTFEFMAMKLKEVVEELNLESITLVGESFGGVVALTYARLYPKNVEKLVMLSSLAKTVLPPEIQWKLDYLLPIVKTLGSFSPSLGQMLFAQVHVDDVIEPSESSYVRNLFIKEASFAHFYSVMERIRIVSTLDIEEDVRSLNVQTLIIYGSDDHFTRKDSFHLHGLIKGSILQELPGGHLPHVTSPKRFAELVTRFQSGAII
jgi:pimeloyl-ACP methyl ester carboxylesterase